ncbi:uncharacterized protein EV154DRAFT_484079 [Mucor mucedo]|uniref:uncharacterized protein n=1 Tax=Mucor mucedo TaxID=29922 RepID=UPI002220C8C6|nr:uncharacterized protein EV154DRAFT_484079 [Mucor mucedo]KAI7888477.1 hypothetical protein EV154DRAFT_484079 [Mucor mucedo]
MIILTLRPQIHVLRPIILVYLIAVAYYFKQPFLKATSIKAKELGFFSLLHIISYDLRYQYEIEKGLPICKQFRVPINTEGLLWNRFRNTGIYVCVVMTIHCNSLYVLNSNIVDKDLLIWG